MNVILSILIALEEGAKVMALAVSVLALISLFDIAPNDKLYFAIILIALIFTVGILGDAIISEELHSTFETILIWMFRIAAALGSLYVFIIIANRDGK